MAQKYLLGLDNGTTGVKAKIYDLDGNIKGEGYREYACVFLKPGWTEQDINMLMNSNYDAIATALKASGVDPKDVAALGLSSQRALHLYVDKDGKVLRNGMGLSWQDGRHLEQLEWEEKEIGKEKYFKLTGLPISSFWAAGKIRWIQKYEPETYEKADKILLTQEYFLHEFGAKDGWFEDWSNGSLYGLMDIMSMEWSEELVKKFEVDKAKLPQLIGSGIQVGKLDKYSAERTGLWEGMPICTGGGDQQCAAVGAGVVEEGLCEVTFGTGGVSVAHLDTPRYDPEMGVTLSAHAFPKKTWESEGAQPAAGGSYKWFRDTVGHLIKYIAPFTKQDPFYLMDLHAKEVPAGSRGVFYLPYLAGSFAPYYDSIARGTFVGLSMKSDFGCMARSVMEGVTFEAKDITDSFRRFIDIREIILSGGATHSPLWCQIQADIYGNQCTVLKEGECTVLGLPSSVALAPVFSRPFRKAASR